MEQNRKVILYIAQSLDGFIAGQNDDISWLSVVEAPNQDYGYQKFIEQVDTVIMGRKTYEKVLSFGIEFPHKNRKCFVLSHTKTGLDENVEFFNGNIKSLIQTIREREGCHIFIDGGSEVVKEFFIQELIDEYVISIIPIIIGNGIRLFQENEKKSMLQLVDTKSYDTGLVQLHYRTIRDKQ
jgi:dihydrofolate reductase